MEGRALLWDKFLMQGNTTDEPYGQVRLRQPGYVYYSGDEQTLFQHSRNGRKFDMQYFCGAQPV